MTLAIIKMMVLKELNNKEQSGYDLMNKIGSLTSDKPSPGYIYPLLRDLEKRGFVSFIEEKRRKVYSITKDGKKFLRNLKMTHERTMKLMIRNFEPISTKNEMREFSKFQARMKKNKDKFIGDVDVMDQFRRAIFSIYEKDYETKRSKLRSIVAKATQQLERLSKE